MKSLKESVSKNKDYTLLDMELAKRGYTKKEDCYIREKTNMVVGIKFEENGIDLLVDGKQRYEVVIDYDMLRILYNKGKELGLLE